MGEVAKRCNASFLHLADDGRLVVHESVDSEPQERVRLPTSAQSLAHDLDLRERQSSWRLCVVQSDLELTATEVTGSSADKRQHDQVDRSVVFSELHEALDDLGVEVGALLTLLGGDRKRMPAWEVAALEAAALTTWGGGGLTMHPCGGFEPDLLLGSALFRPRGGALYPNAL